MTDPGTTGVPVRTADIDPGPPPVETDSAGSELETRVLSRVMWRLIPILGICFFGAYLDRTNTSVAALSMNKDLRIGDAAFGLGSGLFFIGYLVLEVPSNLILHRVGARLWMARIMVTWGLVAGLMAWVSGADSFYLCRTLLGVAEAGFFPGVLLYLTYWFPAAYRARVMGLFMAAVPLSTALGAPLGGELLKLEGVLGFHGWQWLYIAEAIPTVLLGLALLALLPDRPANAKFLTADERAWLTARITAESDARATQYQRFGMKEAMFHPRSLALALIYFAVVFGLYGIGFWMPTLIKKQLSISDNLDVTLLTAFPYLIGTAAMIYWGRRCDRRGTYARHTALPSLIGGVALGASALITSLPWLGYAGFCVAAIGIVCALPCFWTLPNAFLAGATAAAGFASINALGNLSGFAGPYFVGVMKTWFGSPTYALVGIGVVMVAGALLALRLGDRPGAASDS